ncbi:PREDICTED: uncharacterized protein LOC109293009 [Gavialis gangeticus]|uniref:uncharacterized protein LOC109293009 n=1 Tax=Gavialis gangeticus TaxID=94835 RepID=UPI00092EDDE1|nr:PREDICTED: uncharacterized protein LOC109293009 [Gavialis gangeticus]
MQSRERQVPSTSPARASPRPEDSDFLPSVALAGVLCLVFICVSPLLVRGNDGRVPFHDCSALNSGRACSPTRKLRAFRLLFPSQPEATWRALQRSLGGRRWPDRAEGVRVSLVAVGLGEARNTLLCLLKRVLLSLGTERGSSLAARVQVPEDRSAYLPCGVRSERGARSVSIVYERAKLPPYSVTVTAQCSLDGSPLVTETTVQFWRNGTDQAGEDRLRSSTSRLAAEVLRSLCRSGRAPDESRAAARSLPVLFVKPEQYLEGGFVC